MTMTLEQKRAIAIAQAKVRAQQPAPDKVDMPVIKEGQPFMTDDGPAVLRGGQITAIPQSEFDSLTSDAPKAGDVAVEMFGIDPTIEDRPMIFPDNVFDSEPFKASDAMVGAARVVGLPGAVASGAQPSIGDALEVAAAVSPASMRPRVAPSAVTPQTASASEVVKAGSGFDVPVMTTDVKPPKGFVGGSARQLGESIPFAGTSGPRAAQQEARTKAVKSFVDEFAAPNDAEIIASLKSKSKQFIRAAGNVIEQTKNAVDAANPLPAGTNQPGIDMSDVNSTIDNLITDLSNPSRIPDTEAIKRLNIVKESLNAGPQSFDILRDNRTTVRETLEAIDGAGQSQVSSRAKGEFSKVYKSITDALDDTVKDTLGDEALKKYKRADAVYARESEILKKSKIKNVLDKGEVTPELVENMIFSQKPSEIKLLLRNLTPQGRKNVRSALIARAANKATGDNDIIDPSRFANELKKLRKATDVFFTGDSKRRLRGLELLLQSTRRAKDQAAITPTGQRLGPLVGLGVGSFFDIGTSLGTAGTAGVAARLYESPVMRNLLLSLEKASGDPKKLKRVFGKFQGPVMDLLGKGAAVTALEGELNE